MSDILGLENVVDVADRSEFVVITCGAVVDNGELHLGSTESFCFVTGSPLLKSPGELTVCDDLDPIDVGNRGEVVEHPFDHLLARYLEQGFGLVFGDWIESGCVSRGKDHDVHGQSQFLMDLASRRQAL